MPRTVAQPFHTKLGAARLTIESIADAAELVGESKLHTDTLVASLNQKNMMKAARHNCIAMVVNDERLEQDGRRRLLEALADAKNTRLAGQN